MYYSIQHHTKFQYSEPVSETIMEVRLCPRTEWTQHCMSFEIEVTPRVRVFEYRDHLGNTVHHFNVPNRHSDLAITTNSLVEVQPFLTWPDSVAPSAWEEIDQIVARDDYWEMLMPSHYAQPSPRLVELAAKLHVVRRDDPMTVLRQINTGIYESFQYLPLSTRVDSPIDDALRNGKGVCQDFAHIMITLVRQLRIPCRYVSGYVAPKEFSGEAQARARAGEASHAWVEAMLPGLGWVGFDPTNNRTVGDRHIRCAVGRDYFDVPPTKGLFRGAAAEEMTVHVNVQPVDGPQKPDAAFPYAVKEAGGNGGTPAGRPAQASRAPMQVFDTIRQQQQQQQQQ